MREKVGDLFEQYDADAIVITTNACTNAQGKAIMGRGVAEQAARRFPGLDRALGHRLMDRGSVQVQVFLGSAGMTDRETNQPRTVVALPVKYDWSKPASTVLIKRCLDELVLITKALGWRHVVLPRPGCGNGGLNWDDIRPILIEKLDDRFTVVELAAES
jgi:O-acetyl-ADP-ribose deacetylase (regulator of RNase III)